MRYSILLIAVACVFVSTLESQELSEGTWSGTVVRIGQGQGNPQPQRVSLEVKKSPDPHATWRPGKGDVWNVTFVFQQGRSQATNLRLENGSLSFSHKRGDIQMNCRLDRQPDGAYQGQCVGDGDARRFRITLTPPKGPA